MWTRAELKERAWEMLRVSYWKAFVVSLAILFVAGGSGQIFSWKAERPQTGLWSSYTVQLDKATLVGLILALVGVFAIAIVLIIAFKVFVGYPVEVGGRRFFLRAAQGEVDVNNLGYAFNADRYTDIVIAMVWRGFMNFLWLLLLIIPGIIKFFAYSMVPYILGDNPHIGYRRALELSEKMTEGHKWDMFVLGLSFIGWFLLGLLALGVGTLFVNPYFDATHGELYLVLRKNGLDSGLTTYEELCLANPLPPEV